MPSIARADNCGSFSDCYNTFQVALASLLGLGVFAALLSLLLDFTPFVGTIKGFIEAKTGRDLITGEQLAMWQRVLGVVPGGKYLGKVVGKSASSFARSLQGKGLYLGVDRFRDIVLKKGTIIYAGAPGVGNFFTTKRSIFKSNGIASVLFEGLQVSKRNGLYRPNVIAFEVIEDTPAAFGLAKANSKFGKGGYGQIVVENPNLVLKELEIFPLK
ncbi:MAG TPA: pre-toxin TG domain-containing protein [Pyrinomonadaceae bacterium]|nr:pre-toxin TG domain-containing protein [Pyrinomonadaceae bacterium]